MQNTHGSHVKYPILLSNVNNSNMLTNLSILLNIIIPENPFSNSYSCHMQTNMAKIICAFLQILVINMLQLNKPVDGFFKL